MSNIETPVAARRIAVAGNPEHARPMVSGDKAYEVESASAKDTYGYSAEFGYGNILPSDLEGFDADQLERELAELLACPCATTV